MTKRKTSLEYNQQLFEREIDYWPVEEYIDARTPIIHECLKGHKWNVKPSNILGGSNCPQCDRQSKMYTTESYRQSIKYEVLEPYKGSKTKILHRCEQGHEWYVRPNDVINGVGCPLCAKYAFNRDMPAIVYYVLIDDKYYKIGITNRSVIERFKAEKLEIKVIKQWEFNKGSEALLFERDFLSKYSRFRISVPNLLVSGGNTELFSKDVLNDSNL